MKRGTSETYSRAEAQRRFETALRGARVAGHKLQTDMKVSKPKAKQKAKKAKKTSAK